MSKENTNVEPILYDEKGNVISTEPLEEPKLVETEEDVKDQKSMYQTMTTKEVKEQLDAEEAKYVAIQNAMFAKNTYNKLFYENPTNKAYFRLAKFSVYAYRHALLCKASKIPYWMSRPWQLFIADQGTLYVGTYWGPIKPKYQAQIPEPAKK